MLEYRKKGEHTLDYNIIFSNRKTIGLSVKSGILTVRAPFGTKEKRIQEILKKHESWIKKHIQISLEKDEKFEGLTNEKIKILKKEAKTYFEFKMKYFSEIMGLKYGRIKITSAKTRFGSCSSDKNICFSYRLMMCPETFREYVVVHELCHLVHMNHSPKFYALLEKYLPDYKERKRRLK